MIAGKVRIKSTTRVDRLPSEGKLQADAFFNLWKNRPDLRGRLYTINNNSHNQIKGALNKAMGVVESVSDQCFLGRGGRSIYIEWKTPAGSQSVGQKAWQKMVEELGFVYAIVRSEAELLAIIEKYQ